LLIKAALKTKEEVKEREDEGWESVEEDYPHIQIDDLKSIEQQLAGMKIKDDDEDSEDDFDDDEEEIKQKPKPKKK
jgi:hypothetical protein